MEEELEIYIEERVNNGYKVSWNKDALKESNFDTINEYIKDIVDNGYTLDEYQDEVIEVEYITPGDFNDLDVLRTYKETLHIEEKKKNVKTN